MPPTHLERRDGAAIHRASASGFEPYQSGAAHFALCCHTHTAMRSRRPKQKAMCRQTLHCLVTMIAMSVTAPALAQEATTPTGRGELLLTTNCARCHAVGPTGTSPHMAAPPFRTLSRKYKIEGLAEALAEGLSTGHPDMPEFVFAPEDVGAIIDYLQSIQQR